MFGWFSPKCPVDLCEQVWTESRMNWFIAQFGLSRLREVTIILPTGDFFPDRYDGAPTSARQVLDRICGYMQVDPTTIDLDFYRQEEEPNAAGLYHRGERALIRIADTQLQDQQQLIATLAHEVAHEILLGGGLLTGLETDHEWTTDLLTAFLGLGIYGANTAVQQKYMRDRDWESWQISKHGYVPARVYGYAFALMAQARGESTPAWAGHLCVDARTAFAAGTKYLQKNGDTLFAPGDPALTERARTHDELIHELGCLSPGRRIAALWQVALGDAPVPALQEPVLACLRHADAEVRREAADALAVIGTPTQEVVFLLSDLLNDRSAGMRARAAAALGRMGVPLSTIGASGRPIADELVRCIGDESRAVAVAAAQAVAASNLLCEPAAEAILRPLKNALVHCHFDAADGLLSALRVLVPNVRQFLKQRIDDPELRDAALSALRTVVAPPQAASGWQGFGPGETSASLSLPGGQF